MVCDAGAREQSSEDHPAAQLCLFRPASSHHADSASGPNGLVALSHRGDHHVVCLSRMHCSASATIRCWWRQLEAASHAALLAACSAAYPCPPGCCHQPRRRCTAGSVQSCCVQQQAAVLRPTFASPCGRHDGMPVFWQSAPCNQAVMASQALACSERFTLFSPSSGAHMMQQTQRGLHPTAATSPSQPLTR